MNSLTIDNLQFAYDRAPALSGITLRLDSGCCAALIGPNGAGKSTLLKLAAGLLEPGGGRIAWSGRRRAIAYLPQRSAINWHLPVSVRALVEMGRLPSVGWLGRFTRADREAVEDALAATGMLAQAGRQLDELSGGQQQRAFIARALAQQAELLLLDEPFAGLDQTLSSELAALLRALARDGRLILASHHDIAGASDIFDHAVVLNRRLIASGPATSTLDAATIATAYQ